MSLFMCACQTIDITDKKYDCSQLDWFEVGRSDGLRGQNSLGWEQREKDCKGFEETAHESYVNGWYAGINEFCTKEHGFTFGRSGLAYESVCPTGKEEEFLSSYRQGRKVFDFERQNKELSQEVQELSAKAADSEPTEIPELLQRIDQLQTQLDDNRARMSRINREMSDDTSSSQVL